MEYFKGYEMKKEIHVYVFSWVKTLKIDNCCVINLLTWGFSDFILTSQLLEERWDQVEHQETETLSYRWMLLNVWAFKNTTSRLSRLNGYIKHPECFVLL